MALNKFAVVFLSSLAIACSRSTTPFPTTHTYRPPDSCLVDGKVYMDGEKISEAKNKCYGSVCLDGSELYWDHECFFHTPLCYGWEEKLETECCPICHDNFTTTAPPTTVPNSVCTVNGTVYQNGEIIRKAKDKCYHYICNNGREAYRRVECPAFTCPGTLIQLETECCPVCQFRTTTPTTSKEFDRIYDDNGCGAVVPEHLTLLVLAFTVLQQCGS